MCACVCIDLYVHMCMCAHPHPHTLSPGGLVFKPLSARHGEYPCAQGLRSTVTERSSALTQRDLNSRQCALDPVPSTSSCRLKHTSSQTPLSALSPGMNAEDGQDGRRRPRGLHFWCPISGGSLLSSVPCHVSLLPPWICMHSVCFALTDGILDRVEGTAKPKL